MQDKSSDARWMSKRDPEVAKARNPLERGASADAKWTQTALNELCAGRGTGVLQAPSHGTAQVCARILGARLQLSLEKGL